MSVLPDISKMSRDQLEALVQGLARRVDDKAPKIKISEKGVVSMYGFGRWPVSLYPNQWQYLFDHLEDIKTFLEDNREELEEFTRK